MILKIFSPKNLGVFCQITASLCKNKQDHNIAFLLKTPKNRQS
jgi:hypothetical protein